MTLGDLLQLSLENLWRIKLRSILTIAGVVIAIATFVAMLSFGSGTRDYVTEAYTKLGLFTTMNVYPAKVPSDSVAAPLDDAALDKLAAIPGVLLAYPFVGFDVKATFEDTSFSTQARVLTSRSEQSKVFEHLLGGQAFSSDSAKEAFVTRRFLEQCGIRFADSVVGKSLIISIKGASLDSALYNLVQSEVGGIPERLRELRFDSLWSDPYRRKIIETELNHGLQLLLEGLETRQIVLADTLTIKGVLDDPNDNRLRVAPILVPQYTGRRLSPGGLMLSSDPTELFAAMRSGRLLQSEDSADRHNYPQVTLELDPYIAATTVEDSVKALGYRSFSYATEFEQMQRFFLYYNLGLSVIGLIALLTASLGIVNTMIMSIIERRREIGIFRALGADERQVKFMFLVESAVIGFVGAGVGIICGWLATRIISAILKAIMESRGIPPFEIFSLPLWLILVSLAFGTVVSLLAGLYPARRAARLDPVVALRND